YMSGTSMATPHVAGVAALILSSRPSLGWTELKAAIMGTVDPKAALTPYCATGGRLNARGVVTPTPVADDDSYVAAEDLQLIVPAANGVLVGDTDPKGDGLTASREGASGPSHGELTLSADGSFTYTPDANYWGLDQFTYRAFDGSYYSNFATVSITVTPVNDPPSFTAGSDVALAENSGAYSAVWATDISPGPFETESVTFEVTSDNTALFSVQPAIGSMGTLTFTPAAAASGSALVSVTLRDAFGLAGGTGTFTITVTPNIAPVLSAIGNQSVDELALLSFTASATDADLPAQTLRYSLGSGAPSGAAITVGGAFTWTPTEAQGPGSYDVTVVVSDGAVADLETVTITVAEVADPVSVYRFYNGHLGTHFYTADEAEKASVQATLSHIYAFEGEAYRLNPANNTTPLYRFYKPSTGTHFYTASESEKANVQATLAHLYAYEGPAYNVSADGGGGTKPMVWRFYNRLNGTHFYTADASERDSVIANLSHIYTLDGAAFYLGQ
ncbi:MAG: Ig-like domain-containing protein, partial [Coriobacteriia bacterium]